MYGGIFTYVLVYHKFKPNVGKYTIHGAFGNGPKALENQMYFRELLILNVDMSWKPCLGTLSPSQEHLEMKVCFWSPTKNILILVVLLLGGGASPKPIHLKTTLTLTWPLFLYSNLNRRANFWNCIAPPGLIFPLISSFGQLGTKFLGHERKQRNTCLGRARRTVWKQYKNH